MKRKTFFGGSQMTHTSQRRTGENIFSKGRFSPPLLSSQNGDIPFFSPVVSPLFWQHDTHKNIQRGIPPPVSKTLASYYSNYDVSDNSRTITTSKIVCKTNVG